MCTRNHFFTRFVRTNQKRKILTSFSHTPLLVYTKYIANVNKFFNDFLDFLSYSIITKTNIRLLRYEFFGDRHTAKLLFSRTFLHTADLEKNNLILTRGLAIIVRCQNRRVCHTESCPSWSKEHDWKSCKSQNGFEGSNPLLSAIWHRSRRINLIRRLIFSDTG